MEEISAIIKDRASLVAENTEQLEQVKTDMQNALKSLKESMLAQFHESDAQRGHDELQMLVDKENMDALEEQKVEEIVN